MSVRSVCTPFIHSVSQSICQSVNSVNIQPINTNNQPTNQTLELTIAAGVSKRGIIPWSGDAPRDVPE